MPPTYTSKSLLLSIFINLIEHNTSSWISNVNLKLRLPMVTLSSILNQILGTPCYLCCEHNLILFSLPYFSHPSLFSHVISSSTFFLCYQFWITTHHLVYITYTRGKQDFMVRPKPYYLFTILREWVGKSRSLVNSF